MNGDDMPSPAGSLSWRDVYKAVGESEERVIVAVKTAVEPLTNASRDHEIRIRAIELGGAQAATLALAVTVQDGRLRVVEHGLEGIRAKSSGVLATLSAGQKTIVLLCTIAGGILVVFDILSRIAS